MNMSLTSSIIFRTSSARNVRLSFCPVNADQLNPAVRLQPSLLCFYKMSASCVQIAREAEAAMFHRQMFEELRRTSNLTRDPTESVAIGAVEASFKCCASAIIVLTKTGR